MRYRVTAFMTVMLESVIEAEHQTEAIQKGKAEATNGQMSEVDWSGEIHSWEAEAVA